jgi:hypothetical protein
LGIKNILWQTSGNTILIGIKYLYLPKRTKTSLYATVDVASGTKTSLYATVDVASGTKTSLYATAFNQSLAAWGTKFNATVNLANCLDNCGMNVSNYKATLAGFAATTRTGGSLHQTRLT